jgi:hypothetical protein
MHKALEGLFWAIHRARSNAPQRWQKVRLHFMGTSYAPADKAEKTIEPMAQRFQVDDLVDERPARIPYFPALQALCDSHGLLFISSDDPGYSASKIYTYLLAKRPLLPILHASSPLAATLKHCSNAKITVFDASSTAESLGRALLQIVEALPDWPESSDFEINQEAFAQHEAKTMAQRLCAVFDQVCQEKIKQ